MQSLPICAITILIKTLGRCDYLLFLFYVLLLLCREAVVKRPPDFSYLHSSSVVSSLSKYGGKHFTITGVIAIVIVLLYHFNAGASRI